MTRKILRNITNNPRIPTNNILASLNDQCKINLAHYSELSKRLNFMEDDQGRLQCFKLAFEKSCFAFAKYYLGSIIWPFFSWIKMKQT